MNANPIHRCSECLTGVEYLAPPNFTRCHDCEPAPVDTNWPGPTRVLAEELDRAKYWTPWPKLVEADLPEAEEVEEAEPDEDDEREARSHSRYCVDECWC